jgi:hypothetical protein
MFMLQCEARRILVELLPRKAGSGRKRSCRAHSLGIVGDNETGLLASNRTSGNGTDRARVEDLAELKWADWVAENTSEQAGGWRPI